MLNIAASAVSAALAGYQEWWLGMFISISALVLSAVALPLGRSARSNVFAGFADRRLEPLHQRETSIRRERRQKQFAVVALVVWLVAPAFIGNVLAAGGALGLVWSMAWRSGTNVQRDPQCSFRPVG